MRARESGWRGVSGFGGSENRKDGDGVDIDVGSGGADDGNDGGVDIDDDDVADGLDGGDVDGVD